MNDLLKRHKKYNHNRYSKLVSKKANKKRIKSSFILKTKSMLYKHQYKARLIKK